MKTCRRTATEGGFTLLEVLVSMSLTGILMAMVIGSVLLFQGGYATDVVRTRVNSNLRSAMDILSMNIRQAGENLQASFPAVIVEDGEGGAPDVLRVRRSLI